MIFLTTFISIIPIIILIILGYGLQSQTCFSKDFSNDLSKLLMNIALPASVFVSVLNYLTLQKLIDLVGDLGIVLLALALGYLIAFALVKLLHIKAGRRGIFINTVVNANTIFIGLPLNLALFGNKALPYFLVYYIANTISTWTLGAYLISIDSMEMSDSKKHLFDWKKLLPPPLLGFLVAILTLMIRISLPEPIMKTLTYLANLVTPLSLLYIGIMLAKAGLDTIRLDKDNLSALFGRFVVAPLLIVGILFLFQKDFTDLESKTYIIQSATPSLAILPILANQAKGDVAYATNLVTLSTLLFVIVIPIILSILG